MTIPHVVPGSLITAGTQNALIDRVNQNTLDISQIATGGSDAIRFTRVASGPLSGHRVVTPLTNGKLVYADSSTPIHAHAPLWLTIESGLTDQSVEVVAYGSVTEPSWDWVYGPVYLGLNGVLTQTVPVSPDAYFSVRVGVATSVTSMFVNPQPSILLD